MWWTRYKHNKRGKSDSPATDIVQVHAGRGEDLDLSLGKVSERPDLTNSFKASKELIDALLPRAPTAACIVLMIVTDDGSASGVCAGHGPSMIDGLDILIESIERAS